MKTFERDRVREICKKMPQDVYIDYTDLRKIKIFFFCAFCVSEHFIINRY